MMYNRSPHTPKLTRRARRLWDAAIATGCIFAMACMVVWVVRQGR